MLDSVRPLEVNVLKRSKERQTQWMATTWTSSDPAGAMIPRQSIALTAAAPPQRLLSSKQLDLLLLAACSCLLTVLCHPVVTLQSASTNGAAAQSATSSTAAQMNFYVKSALMSSFQQGEGQEVKSEED